MCGRFTLTTPAPKVTELLDVSPLLPGIEPRYNIAPTQPVAAARLGDGGRELVLLRWGLVAPWAKDLKGVTPINARADGVAYKPMFRHSFKRRRCLIPADGFLEWKAVGGKKQPYHFRRRDAEPFAFAGIWEQWQPQGADALESCAIVTTEANELVRPVHDRMPVLLRREDFSRWLDPSTPAEQLLALLRPYPAEEMVAVPVSTRVNNARNEGPACLEPVA
jgi:putative SOS response-associated peptidase YedK